MRCFFHGDVEAVAVCKGCGRAICHECCAEVDTSISCRNRCEGEVQALDHLRRRGTKNLSTLPKLYWGISIMFGGYGLWVLLGALFTLGTDHLNLDGMVFGGLFAALGVGCAAAARRFKK